MQKKIMGFNNQLGSCLNNFWCSSTSSWERFFHPLESSSFNLVQTFLHLGEPIVKTSPALSLIGNGCFIFDTSLHLYNNKIFYIFKTLSQTAMLKANKNITEQLSIQINLMDLRR